jgi:hypothetical protein
LITKLLPALQLDFYVTKLQAGHHFFLVKFFRTGLRSVKHIQDVSRPTLTDLDNREEKSSLFEKLKMNAPE